METPIGEKGSVTSRRYDGKEKKHCKYNVCWYKVFLNYSSKAGFLLTFIDGGDKSDEGRSPAWPGV